MTPGVIPYGMFVSSGPSAPSSPPSCSWLGDTFDFWFNKPAWTQCQIAQGQAQIQNVADRTAYYYGPDSRSAAVAQAAADEQKAQVPQDVEDVANYYGAGSLIATPGQGMPTWVMAALLVGGLWLLRNMNS